METEIELTDNLLLSYGFEKSQDGAFVLDNIAIFLDKRLKENVFLYSSNEYDGDWNVVNNLKVHNLKKLQDLYFLLTEKKLKPIE
jgi:hypothetical protein